MGIKIAEIDWANEGAVQGLFAGSEPGVLRGVAAHWRIVTAAHEGEQAVLNYLALLLGQREIEISDAEPAHNGRFHYTPDLRGFTFRRRRLLATEFLSELAAEARKGHPRALAAQGLRTDSAAPAFLTENPLPIRPEAGEARLWIGNRARVAAHSDPADNLAYCACGRRRFTLFPPEQLANLYFGPFDPTPAGTPIAMTDPLEPDFQRYPRFAAALDAAKVAELDPGDALFIPYGWFHHVEALSAVSVLVNTWWPESGEGIGSPWDALLHAFMALRPLGPKARRHWAAMLHHYGLEQDGDSGAHLPPHARGVLGARSPQDLAAMRAALLRNLSQGH